MRKTLPHHIFGAAYRIMNREPKHRDDLMMEVEWWLYWMATVTDPASSTSKLIQVGTCERMPINAILERAYEKGLVSR